MTITSRTREVEVYKKRKKGELFSFKEAMDKLEDPIAVSGLSTQEYYNYNVKSVLRDFYNILESSLK